MGFSVSFAGMVMGAFIAKAKPEERPVLGRFLPVMSRVGDVGLILLWGSGLTLLFFKWGGFKNTPPTFHAKITLVVALTLLVGYIHALQGRLKRGDLAVQGRMQTAGKFAFLLAVSIVVLAVLSFN
jgi:uncharacterized membrane protein